MFIEPRLTVNMARLRRACVRAQCAALLSKLPQRFEGRAHFADEQFRLFPRREVGAFGELVVVDELHIRFF